MHLLLVWFYFFVTVLLMHMVYDNFIINVIFIKEIFLLLAILWWDLAIQSQQSSAELSCDHPNADVAPPCTFCHSESSFSASCFYLCICYLC
jgi:hypothetical protein